MKIVTNLIAYQRSLVSITLVLVVCCWPTSSTAQRMDRDQYRSMIIQAVEDVSRPMGLFVDPVVVESFIGDIDLYYGSFCEAPSAVCKIKANDNSVVVKAIRDFLSEYVRSQPTSIRRLAARIGEPQDMARLGQVEDISVRYALINLGNRPDTSPILIKRLPRLVEFKGRGTRLLTFSGRLEIGQRTNDTVSWTMMLLLPNQTTTFSTSVPLPAGNQSMGNLTHPVDAFCSESPPIEFVGPHAMFNWGRATIGEEPAARYAKLVQFAKSSVVDLSIEIDPAFSCDGSCRQDIAAVFVQSFAAWKAGCVRCDLNAFSFIRAGGNIWIADQLEGRLISVAQGNPTLPLDLGRDNNGKVIDPSTSRGGFGAVVAVNYSNITSDIRRRQQICALPSAAAPWVAAAKSVICEGGTGGSSSSSLLRASLNFLNRPSSCGDVAVACGLPNSRVEINGASYGFIVPRASATGSEYRLGKGSVLLDFRPVVMHEVGHWFGVPHSDVAKDKAVPDIMSTPYGTGPLCISRQTTIMLNNAADERWSDRLTTGGGALMPPALRRSGR